MKAILEFNLPEDAALHKWAVASADMASEIMDLDNNLRSWIKHGHQFKDADEALRTVREFLADAVDLAFDDSP